jgi:hypothetical protein
LCADDARRNERLSHPLKWMALYFFDFRSGDAFSEDEEGRDLPHLSAAHSEATAALADAFSEIIVEGAAGQTIAVEVRDNLGPVLKVTAVVESRILRKQ